MLHEFRARLGVSGFRSISTEILQPIVETYAASQRSIALIDSTDLPASDVGFKKKTPVPTVPEAPGWEPVFSIAEVDGDELVDAEDWCIGFLQAMDLAPEAWAAPESSARPIL